MIEGRLLALLLLSLASASLAFNDTRQLDPEDRSGNWSLGFAYTWQDSVYDGESYRTDFMPTFTYTGEKFFLDTTDFGWHAIDNERWQLDVFSSYYIDGYNDHYLEFSLDVSVGDIFGVDEIRNLFFGFTVHHRSGIFASANLYGNVYGGSNVNALYLEWELGK